MTEPETNTPGPTLWSALDICRWDEVETDIAGVKIGISFETKSIGFIRVFDSEEEARAECPKSPIWKIQTAKHP